jgi:FAD synthase
MLRFDFVEALVGAMADDVARARDVLRAKPPG